MAILGVLGGNAVRCFIEYLKNICVAFFIKPKMRGTEIIYDSPIAKFLINTLINQLFFFCFSKHYIKGKGRPITFRYWRKRKAEVQI